MNNKQDIRKLLIETAHEVFLSKGYANSSIRAVASEAGITSGLVSYYFRSKDDLLYAVHDYIQKKYQAGYYSRHNNTIELSLKEIKSRVIADPDWYRWRYELFKLGLEREDMRPRVKSLLNEGRTSIAIQLRKYLDDETSVDGLASLLLASFDGLALQWLIDDTFSLDESYNVLSDVLNQYITSVNARVLHGK